MLRIFIFSLFLFFSTTLTAQSSGFSEGKSLIDLRAALYAKAPFFEARNFKIANLSLNRPVPPAHTAATPFLPHWSSENLPFFCKIEHNWGKKARLPFKFRLGSVEYVDWLEGK